MQAQLKKKDTAPKMRCPRCHAENASGADKCIKCGYVFPLTSVAKGAMPHIPGTLPQAQSQGMGGADDESGSGGEGEEDGEEEPSEEDLKPKRPKHIPESGEREGIISTVGESRKCPRCGSDVKSYSKRCLKCGQKM